MNNETTEQVNRYIHEQIMGRCWHVLEQINAPVIERCKKCPFVRPNGKYLADMWPDYCSDESPRSLLNEAVAKAIETMDYHEWVYFVHEIQEAKNDQICGCCEGPRLLMATAEQLARACVEAHRSSAIGEGNQ